MKEKNTDQNEKWPKYEEWPEGLKEEIKERGTIFKIAQVIFALSVLIGLIYLSGLYQYFFFYKTPSSIQQKQLESVIDAEKISFSLNIFILKNNEDNGSKRSKKNAKQLVKNASNIWGQAAINFQAKEIYILERSDKEIEMLFKSPSSLIKDIKEFNSEIINLFLVEKLKGINGLAFPGLQIAIVADYTTRQDFRVLAHEIGHILDLSHIENKSSLMHQGANGTSLSISEIFQAREEARKL